MSGIPFEDEPAYTLARHVMDQAVVLTTHANALAGADPVKRALLADITQQTLSQIKRDFYNWGI